MSTDPTALDPTALDPTALDPAPGELPAPAQRPTLYFIGVTTGRSSIRQVFPRWAERLGLGDVAMVGIDLPLHAPREDYRRVVEFMAADPLSRGRAGHHAQDRPVRGVPATCSTRWTRSPDDGRGQLPLQAR